MAGCLAPGPVPLGHGRVPGTGELDEGSSTTSRSASNPGTAAAQTVRVALDVPTALHADTPQPRATFREILTKPRVLVLATALLSECVMVLIAVRPDLRFAYDLPELRIVIETIAAGAALLAAYLMAGRFKRSRRLDDLLLVCALGALASSNFFFKALPASFSSQIPGDATTWAALVGTVVGSLLFAWAAYAPPQDLKRSWTPWVWLLAPALLVLDAFLMIRNYAPSILDRQAFDNDFGKPQVVGHPLFLAGQVVAMTAMFAAAVGLAKRAEETGDSLIRWFAVATVFAGFARLTYFLFPSFYPERIYIGDVFRLLFYVVLVIGVERELRGYWRSATFAAVLEERRRIARDLHDGAAQELSFIVRRLHRLPYVEGIGPIAAAAERALDDSRRAIAALSRPLDEPLDQLLVQIGEEMEVRTGAKVEVDAPPLKKLEYETADAIIRIASEAILNAARHGGASSIRVYLSPNGKLLRVRDDGDGFDVGRLSGDGFGLVSMRERAASVGADLRLESTPGQGTTVELEFA
jgi:signal transduction histidine kinase